MHHIKFKSRIYSDNDCIEIKKAYKLAKKGKVDISREACLNYSIEKKISLFINDKKEPSDFVLDCVKYMIMTLKIIYSDGEPLVDDYEYYDPMLTKYKKYREEPYAEVKFVKKSRLSTDVGHEFPTLKGTLDKANKLTIESALNPNDYALETFIDKILDIYTESKLVLRLTKKFDGTSGILSIDENGKVDLMLTRGDDGNGSDITILARNKRFKGVGRRVGLKTEMLNSKKNFNEYCKRTGKNYKNMRTSMTSILERDDRERFSDLINYVALKAIDENGNELDLDPYQDPEIKNYYTEIKSSNKFDIMQKIEDFAKEVLAERNDLEYAIDGIVISCMNPSVRKKLGRKNDINKFEIAYKFPAQVEYTKARDIKISVGRTGLVVPMLYYDKIHFNGTTHDHSSLSSYDRFKAMNLHENEPIKVTYNNDVMPYPHKMYPNYDSGKLLKFPDKCICGNKLKLVGANYYCDNPLCPGKKVAALEHFYKSFGIEDVSEKSIEVMLGNSVISGIADAYMPNYKLLLSIDGFAEKSVKSFKNQIQHKLLDAKISEDVFVSALGISGQTNAKKILNVIHLFELLKNPNSLYETTISGIGNKMKDDFLNKLNLTKDVIMQYADIINIVPVKNDNNIILAFTGFRDKKLAQGLLAFGYEVKEGITKKTNILIARDTNSAKCIKLKEKYPKLKIMSIDEFAQYMKDENIQI